ncbi:MAG: hypothetical protein IJ588_07540 [Prevotella sp.]|nr:hypothetical protein [Prevotella sp.]
MIKHILLAGIWCCGMTACSEWDDHYEGTIGVSESGSTLWEQMKADAQLSDFCEVLEQTKVYRMHQKKPVSYADILGSGQAFTVMAPLNGTFNKDSLLQLVQTAVGDSSVEKSFVQNHLSHSLVSVTSDSARMLMLNLKRIGMADGSIGGVPVAKANTRAANGVLHTLQKALPYNYNIYEMLCDNPQLEGIGARLRRFNEDVFDAAASVSSGVVDGVPVYVDSVVYERNRLLERIGELNAEDSTYLAVVPATDGWNEVWDEAFSYYNFEDNMEKRDSLQQFYTTSALLQDAIFNMTDQKSPKDSLISVPYLAENVSIVNGKHVYHVFPRPFDEGGILYGAQPLDCSNGTVYTADKWPFTPEQTYFKELYVEGESTYLITDYEKCVYNIRQVTADSISEGRYLRIAPLQATDNWSVEFQVNNTLSGSYDVYAVILPKSVYNQTSPDQRPCKFKATINYIGQNGKTATYSCTTPDNKTEFQSDPQRIDTVLIAQGFKFPVCSYGQNGKRASIKLTCSITSRQTSTYAREMYLDCIYLKPRTSKSE